MLVLVLKLSCVCVAVAGVDYQPPQIWLIVDQGHTQARFNTLTRYINTDDNNIDTYQNQN